MARRNNPPKPRHGHTTGGSLSPTYSSWANMLKRCRAPANPKFPLYGGRGITVCERWHLFDNFLADMGDKPDSMTLERIDVNGNYEPANCCWASPKDQANNKTTNRIIEWNGKSQTSARWADELGISYGALRQRLHRGWTLDRVFNQLVRGHHG